MAALSLQALLSRGDLVLAHEREEDERVDRKDEILGLDWPELEGALPDRGLPRGVVEIAAPHTLGGATRIAIAAIRAAQARNPRAWCAFLDPEATLYAPGLVKSGIDLARLLVVRPERKDLARVSVKVASARAFDVLAIDMSPLEHATQATPRDAAPKKRDSSRSSKAPIRPEILVRKLALLAEESNATFLLLSDSTAPRPAPWPVALRIESSREHPSKHGALTVRVTKDRYARIGLKKIVSLASIENVG